MPSIIYRSGSGVWATILMDQDQERKSVLLMLPTELLVYIFSFVSSLRDRVKLRYVSNWLRCIVEGTPSLWKEFVWPYYDSREEYRVKEALKACGQHVKILSFPYCRVPSILVEMLQYCSNVQRLSLPLTRFDNELVTKALSHAGCLQALDLQTVEFNTFNQDDFRQLLNNVSHLRELIVDIDCNGCLLNYLRIWMEAKCRPPNLNAFSTTRNFMTMHFSSFIPPATNANVRLYDRFKMAPLRFTSQLPFFQMHFEESGQLTTLCVKLSDYGILGLEEDVAVMNDCWYGGRMLHAVRYRNEHIVRRLTWPHTTTFCNPSCTTHCTFSQCYSLHSGHLEQLAIACPNLQRLSLLDCDCCLESLQGLKAIAGHCRYLQGLNILGIHVSKVEDHVVLWEVLSKMRLTHLAVEFCLLRSEAANKEKLVCLYQNCWTIRAIQCHSCPTSCGDFTVKDVMMVSYFPSLNRCFSRINSSCKQNTVVQDMIRNCKTLKCASFIASHWLLLILAHNHNLQQLYLDSPDTVALDDFMTSVSAYGGLVHVVMVVGSVSTEGITSLMMNSPKLMTLEVITDHIRHINMGLDNFNASLKEVYSSRTSGHYMVRYRGYDHKSLQLKVLSERGTDLLPLWD